MLSRMLVDATDLDLWAHRRDAQGLLPKLLRRLILTTVDRVLRIGFRAQEGVQLSGWDGLAIVKEGNAFVPDGHSGWEVSTRRDTSRKANQDYENRRTGPFNADPSESVFVFVTPRRWEAKHDWAAAKKEERFWRDVRTYDADDLALWLGSAPSVHIWFSTLLGRCPQGATDFSSFWKDWSEATDPPMSVDLVISGREECKDHIHQWLRGEPSSLTVQAESREEALAFFLASLVRLPSDEKMLHLARGVVVEDAAVWRQLTLSDHPLLLVPKFDSSDVLAGAVPRGHHVLVPLGRDHSPSHKTIQIPRLKRKDAEEALGHLGFSERRAGYLSVLARRSLTAFRRKLAISPEVQRPAWAQPNHGREILSGVLAGTWSDRSEGDRDALATLARSPYDDLKQTLTRWANESDPPIRCVGDAWMLVAKEDSWSLLSRFITREDLEVLAGVVLDVLGRPDPGLELPADRRWMAGALGYSSPYSGLLREGLADTLALMGARSDLTKFTADGSAQDHASMIVRQLLERANGDWRLWVSLSGVLPLLGEAAPDEFLNAVEVGLSGDEPVLLNLFRDSEDGYAPFTSSPHTGLLWALETLAWNPEYLGHTAVLLARLAALDPGGKLLNRPQNSLREIFLTWHPQTAASLSQRLRVLDAIRSREPEVAWQLLCQLLPSLHAVAHPTHSPRRREWMPDSREQITYQEIGEGGRQIAERLIADVGNSGERWQDLIHRIDGVPTLQLETVFDRLENVDIETLSWTERAATLEALGEEISKHRRDPDANWTLPEEHVGRLEEMYETLQFSELTSKARWLFRAEPTLVDPHRTSLLNDN